IAADAVRQMHDIIAFTQLEKAVDDAPESTTGRPAQVGAMKQFAAGDQNDPPAHEPKARLHPAYGKMQSALRSEPRFAEQFAQSVDFGFGRTDDVHFVSQAHRVEFVA